MRTCLPLVLSVCLIQLATADPKRPYKVNHQAPLLAQEKVLRKSPSLVRSRIEFNGIQGDRVPALLYAPAKSKVKRQAVLLQYGTGGSKASRYIVAFAQEFAKAGFVVLTIDAPYRGERKKKGYKDNLVKQMHPGVFTQYCGDYSRAVDYLKTRSDVAGRRIGYVGISWGAITGVTYAAHDKRIRAVASIVGGGAFGKLLGHGQDPKKSKHPSIDPVDHVGLIAPRPLLMLNVRHDWLIPRVFSTALHRSAGKNSKVVWMDTDHRFSTVDRLAMMRSVVEFMAKSLK